MKNIYKSWYSAIYRLEIIQTFSRPLPETQIAEIRQILSDYFAKKIDDGVNELFEQQGWDNTKTDEWLNEHLRTPYQHLQ